MVGRAGGEGGGGEGGEGGEGGKSGEGRVEGGVAREERRQHGLDVRCAVEELEAVVEVEGHLTVVVPGQKEGGDVVVSTRMQGS